MIAWMLLDVEVVVVVVVTVASLVALWFRQDGVLFSVCVSNISEFILALSPHPCRAPRSSCSFCVDSSVRWRLSVDVGNGD